MVQTMSEFTPKISIVIPVYNGDNYLREAVDSALAQTYKNIEVLVVNDGSTDDGATERIALSYGDRIRYFRKENGGVASALNLGIREMRGEYFSWLSHDDVYYPDKIAFQVEWLQQHGGQRNVILYGDYDHIDSASLSTGQTRIRHLEPVEFIRHLITDHPVNGCTMLVPRACFDMVGVFNEQLKTTQDYDLWFRMAWKCGFVHIPHLFIKSRIHPQQGSVAVSPLMHQEQNEFFIDYLSKIRSSKEFADAPSCLLQTSIHLVKNKFAGAGAYGYAAARSRMAEEGQWSFGSLFLMAYYHAVAAAARLLRALR